MSTCRHSVAVIVATSALALGCAPALAAPPANHPPRAKAVVGKPDPATGRVLVRIKARDADGDRLRYRAPSITDKGFVRGIRSRVTMSPSGTFAYTPTAAAAHAASSDTATVSDTTDSFTVTVSDGYGGTVSVPVTVAIAPQNAAPIPSAPTVNPPDPTSGVVTGSVSATDPDGDPLSYSVLTPPAKGTVSVAPDGTFTYTPTPTAPRGAPADATTDTFTITITDGYGGSVAVPVSVPSTSPART